MRTKYDAFEDTFYEKPRVEVGGHGLQITKRHRRPIQKVSQSTRTHGV